MPINIVVFEPQIPQNTGNIARTVAATQSRLHLVGPMGFVIDDKKLKRAGLDYWHLLDITYYKNTEDFFKKNSGEMFFFSTKSPKYHTEAKFSDNCYLIFGREDKGISEEILNEYVERCVRIPMFDQARSLNLSNAVAIGVYEALRQNNYFELKTKETEILHNP